MSKLCLSRGASADAILLVIVKLVTTLLGLTVTRLLSQYLAVYDYGTYSQILLITSTVSSLTILGMMDGINYFYCAEPQKEKRENDVSSMFSLQCMISAGAGCAVLLLSAPLCTYFDNPDVRKLLIFAATLPMLQNLISMLQILLISVGKAKLLAVRNFAVSAIRLLIVLLVISAVQSVAVVLATTLLLDIAQIILFVVILRKADCRIRIQRIQKGTVGRIFRYCAPMAVFISINALNRDIDKYLVSLWTDTETLAVYSNASKILPFDIIISAFTTVLLPQITRSLTSGQKEKAANLYRLFLEIAYLSTTVLCCAALAASPQLMELLYTSKYLSGLSIFQVYILVDMIRFTNITMVLSAAGKTKKLMFLSFGALALNALLNIILFRIWGIVGPAIATLITTLVLGLAILSQSAKALEIKPASLFDWKFLLRFAAESLCLTLLLYYLQQWLSQQGIHYFLILVIICGIYGLSMLILHGKHLLRLMKRVNAETR